MHANAISWFSRIISHGIYMARLVSDLRNQMQAIQAKSRTKIRGLATSDSNGWIWFYFLVQHEFPHIRSALFHSLHIRLRF